VVEVLVACGGEEERCARGGALAVTRKNYASGGGEKERAVGEEP